MDCKQEGNNCCITSRCSRLIGFYMAVQAGAFISHWCIYIYRQQLVHHDFPTVFIVMPQMKLKELSPRCIIVVQCAHNYAHLRAAPHFTGVINWKSSCRWSVLLLLDYRKFHLHIGAAVFAAPSNWCALYFILYLYHPPHMHAGCLHFHHCRVNIKFRAARFVMKLFYDSSQKLWAKWKASKMQCYAATEASLVHSVCIPPTLMVPRKANRVKKS